MFHGALQKAFLRGLMAVLPLGITIALVVWLVVWLERNVQGTANYILRLLPWETTYKPGMGIALGLVAICLVGFLLQYWLMASLWRWFERAFNHIPLVRTLYTAVTDLMSFFADKDRNLGSQVVSVELRPGVRIIGFITRSNFDDLPPGMGNEGDVAVYLPLSYQIGGYTVLMPRSQLTPVAMGVEEAMRFAVTAGVRGQHGHDHDRRHSSPPPVTQPPVDPPPTDT